MEPDAVQKQNEPFECRFILLGALSHLYFRNCIYRSQYSDGESGSQADHSLDDRVRP